MENEQLVADNYFFDNDIVAVTLSKVISGLSLESALDVLNSLARNIAFKPDRILHVQSPTETITAGAGACDDLAALCVNPLLLAGFDAEVIIGDVLNYTTATMKHAWVKVGNYYFDPTAHVWEDINSMTTYTPIMQIRRP